MEVGESCASTSAELVTVCTRVPYRPNTQRGKGHISLTKVRSSELLCTEFQVNYLKTERTKMVELKKEKKKTLFM